MLLEYYNEITLYIKEKFSDVRVKKQSENLGWMFFARIGSMVITLLATSYIARNLGPTNYGQLSYAISFAGLFSFIASLGIDQILHRDLIKYPTRRNEILGSAIVLRLIASIISIIVTVITAFLVSSKDVSLLLIGVISFSSLLGSFQLLGYEFQAESKSKYPSILSLTIVFLLNILKIVTIYFDGGIIYLAGIVILEPLLYSIGYMYLKSKFYKDLLSIHFNKNTAFSILKDSYPLIFASAFFLIYSRIDQVMLKNMINAEAVGLYDAAVRISELSYFVPQLFLVAFLPAIVNAKSFSEELYYKRTKKLLLLITLISFAIAIFMTVFGKHILLLIFGASFIGSLSALYICAWSTVGAALNSFAQQLLVTENMTKHITITTFFGMVINIVLNLILIPEYGIAGAAMATLISYMVPFASLLLFRKTRIIVLRFLKI